MSYTSLYVLPGNKGSVHRVMLPHVSQPAWVVAGRPEISEDQLQSGQAPLSAATAELLILSMIEEEGRRWRLYC